MAVKEVLKLGNPILREESEPIKKFDKDLEEIVEDLKDTLINLQQEKKTGRALAAPQIAYLKKVVYASVPDEEIIMINPEINWKSSEMFYVWDSCFSMDIAFFVKILRHKKIRVNYITPEGENIEREFTDDMAELFQHEIDHLYGIMAADHLKDNKNIIMRSEYEKKYSS
ncbi:MULTISPECIES: peptide deformylase [unclassified Halanaerobium]|uniref:peptide deformylase n=1 Tax=unclassified Halanaerobium TaxID=2641197 RepID=UPI000DF2D8EC|nr:MULTISPECIES: peptide deformylase [unclassified Halanaerobium]RCW47737.1 peptide deformylase [Halanaerobium sp. MA284_MarDTE_T2]RCW87976.1 peptide deformylase [Halanaerobium sp. DL-01]